MTSPPQASAVPLSERGIFVVLEGIDGSGTTTQVARLQRTLEAEGYGAYATREPSTGAIGKLLRAALEKRLKDDQGQVFRFDWSTMALLFAADRVDHVDREITPELARGRIVISDRYDLSSIIYQSETCPDGPESAAWIAQINSRARRPDLTLVLDVPAEVAAARRQKRGGEAELYEVEELQGRLAKAYRRAESLLSGDRIVVLDGRASMDDLAKRIHQEVLAVRRELSGP